ncbi:hypothetical protein Bca52824_015359 [Brassica carinata]|uniref:Uncharacterized protein n=1 Tax=Brassica carinata TaxID=52824 RepID=A0A8X7W1Y7_BRACI|nr:hypothetical protein Bca52824_015359 [Brassica carinata]
MNTSMSTIVFSFVVLLSISAISLAKQSPLEACIRKNIARSLSPPPSNKPDFDVSDELCRDETRTIMIFLRLNGEFPPYYVEALCNVFGSDKKKVKEYVTTRWLNHSKKLLHSLTCTTRRTTLVVENKSHVETCIRRNIAQSLSPSPSNDPNTSRFDIMRDQLCRDETRIIMHFLLVNGEFPPYYVEALCNVFGDDEKKVKEYVIRKWLDQSKKLIDSLACASP